MIMRGSVRQEVLEREPGNRFNSVLYSITARRGTPATAAQVQARARLSWWKGVRRLIRCTIVPLIHRQARINHLDSAVNPAKGTKPPGLDAAGLGR